MNQTRSMKKPMGTYAVLMGDIIHSRTYPPGGALLNRVFNEAINTTNKKYRSDLASPLTITLGDEFQGLAKTTVVGLQMIMKLRAELQKKGVDCRFVLGLAKLETKINRRMAWNMTGPGLPEARERLNDKDETNIYRFSLFDDPVRQRLLDAVGLSLTMIELDWTPTQQRYYRLLQAGEKQDHIARRFRISPRSVYKVLQAGQLTFYRHQMSAINFALEALDKELGLS